MIIPSDHWVKDGPKYVKRDYPTLSKLIDNDDDLLLYFLLDMGDDQIIKYNYLLHHKERS